MKDNDALCLIQNRIKLWMQGHAGAMAVASINKGSDHVALHRAWTKE